MKRLTIVLNFSNFISFEYFLSWIFLLFICYKSLYILIIYILQLHALFVVCIHVLSIFYLFFCYQVIDLNEVDLEELTEEEDMEEEDAIVDMATTVFSKHEGVTFCY